MFFIKQVANDLGITPQAIYKQKEDLIDKGYMLKTTTNDWEITAEGYNYLKERQINRVKRKQVELKEGESISTKNTENNVVYSLNETLKNFYGNNKTTENSKTDTKGLEQYLPNRDKADARSAGVGERGANQQRPQRGQSIPQHLPFIKGGRNHQQRQCQRQQTSLHTWHTGTAPAQDYP